MSELPKNWSFAELGELCEINPKHSRDIARSTLVSFVPMPAVDEVDGRIVTPSIRSLDDVLKGFTHFADGDVLFAKITPCMENGKAAIASGLSNGLGCGSTEFHVLRTKGALDPRYLWRFLRQQTFRDDAAQAMTGVVGQRRVPTDYLRSAKIPTPPLAEQRRIVSKLNSLTGRTARAREQLGRIPKLIQKYRDAILAAAFTGELTKEWRVSNNDLRAVKPRSASEMRAKYRIFQEAFDPPFDVPSTWRWLRLPELGELDRGKSKHRPRNAPVLYGGPYPFIQTGEVRAADQYLSTYSKTYSEAGLAQSRLWPTGTVCITIAANIAETAILSIEACFPDSVVGLLPDKTRTNAQFVEFFLRTARADLAAFAPATAQKNINLDTLGNIRLPSPPLLEQQEIVRRIETAFAWLDRVAAEHGNASRLLPRLDQAILAKAFRGELVPQDPNDKPVEISADTTAESPSRRGRLRQASN